jgi:hypothetical protein
MDYRAAIEKLRRVGCDTYAHNYLLRYDMSIQSLARDADLDYHSVCRAVKGLGLPSLPAAYRIDEATEGRISPATWFKSDLGKLVLSELGGSYERWVEQTREAARRARARKEER